MARCPRIIVRKYGDLIEVTTRTVQGRMLLNPCERINEVVLGVLGRALHLHPEVGLVAFVFMSNHYHLLLRVADAGVLAKLIGYINSNIARKVGKLQYWPEKFWGRRYRGIQVVDDVSAESRLRYVLAHGAKEGLVARPGQWPGAHCHEALLHGAPIDGVWLDWTKSYHKRRRGSPCAESGHSTRYPVPLVPLPGWEGLSETERQARVAAMVAGIEREAAEQNEALGRTPPGAQLIREQDAHDTPQDFERRPAPACHAATKELRDAYRTLICAFVAAYQAAARLARQVRPDDVEFPPGCFPPAPPFVLEPDDPAQTHPPPRGELDAAVPP